MLVWALVLAAAGAVGVVWLAIAGRREWAKLTPEERQAERDENAIW